MVLDLSKEDRSEPARPIFWDRAPLERLRISMYLTTNLTIMGGQVGVKDVTRYLESQGWRESERTDRFLRLSHPDYSRTIRMPPSDRHLTRSEVCALVALANLDEDLSMKAAVAKCAGGEAVRR